jgi:hypothetical protein
MRFFVMANTVAPTGVPIVPLERVSEFRFKSMGEGDMYFVHALSFDDLVRTASD